MNPAGQRPSGDDGHKWDAPDLERREGQHRHSQHEVVKLATFGPQRGCGKNHGEFQDHAGDASRDRRERGGDAVGVVVDGNLVAASTSLLQLLAYSWLMPAPRAAHFHSASVGKRNPFACSISKKLFQF